MERKLSNEIDTIAAEATPPGRGGISIVRVSGPLVKNIIVDFFGCELTPRLATYLPFCDEFGVTFDEGVAIFFPNPHSFTGEDIVELQGHGGPVVVDLLLQRLLKLGARLARPGEFSERAFLNGKIDLTQAEAIADLIDASSKQAARLAMRSLQGEFSKAIHALIEKVIYLRMYIEASIDFTDEEIDFLSDAKIHVDLERIILILTEIQENAKQGSFLREGITAVIVGAPNVGKSSLLNCLSGKDVAIVTPIAGTTRDVLRDYILIDGMPMHIIDTAGLRESEDIVELEGIRRAYQEIEKADVVLYVVDASHHASFVIPDMLLNKKTIIIRNKVDLTEESCAVIENESGVTISLSAKSGAGLDLFKQQLKALVGFKSDTQGVFLARRRHLDALARATAPALKESLIQITNASSLECAAEDLRLAQLALSEITGEFTTDDLLGRIFSSFCVGK